MMFDLLNSIENPLMREWVVPLVVLGIAIAIVTAALKKDDVPGILRESVKVFVLLGVGFVLFCVALYVLGDPHAPFGGR